MKLSRTLYEKTRQRDVKSLTDYQLRHELACISYMIDTTGKEPESLRFRSCLLIDEIEDRLNPKDEEIKAIFEGNEIEDLEIERDPLQAHKDNIILRMFHMRKKFWGRNKGSSSGGKTHKRKE